MAGFEALNVLLEAVQSPNAGLCTGKRVVRAVCLAWWLLMEEASEFFGSPLWVFEKENTNSYVSVEGVM